MRNLLIAALTLCSLTSFAQTDSLFEFKLIDSVGASKQELYSRARQFVALNFKDSKNVIQMDDKDAGKIICKGVMTIFVQGHGTELSESFIDFTMKIDVKDNKYRCVLSEFYHDGFNTTRADLSYVKGGPLVDDKPCCSSAGFGFNYINKSYWATIKSKTKEQANSNLLAFKNAMEVPLKDDNF